MKSLLKFGTGTVAGLILGLALVLGYAAFQGVAQALSVIAPPAAGQAASTSTTATTAEPRASLAELEQTVTGIYDRISPAVVFIVSEGAIQSTPFGDFPDTGAGSGVIIDDQGHILTNNHVVAGAVSLEVTLADGSTYPARVVGRDPGNDLALIKIDAPREKLVVAPLGDSAALRPGQLVIAIGSPFGLEGSVTVGFVSQTDRDRATTGRPIKDMIQTDAAINPGNSGGPLLNSSGEVIGINTSIESPVRGSVGVGFAVPINAAKAGLAEMKAGGIVQHPWLGISGRQITPALARELGLGVESGVYVVTVTPNSPAAAAGLKGAQVSRGTQTPQTSAGGDVITEIDGRPVKQVEDISDYLDTKKVGDTVTLTILREGQRQTLQATLTAWPERLGQG